MKTCDFGGEPEEKSDGDDGFAQRYGCLKMASAMVAEAVLAVSVISVAEDSMSACVRAATGSRNA